MFFVSEAVVEVVRLMDEDQDGWRPFMGDWKHSSGICVSSYRIYGNEVSSPDFGLIEHWYVNAAMNRLSAAKIRKTIQASKKS